MKRIYAHIARLLPKDHFFRSVTVLAGGTAIGQGIVLVASPILTRLYTSTDFGILAVFGSIIGILSVLSTFRYEEAIPLPQGDADAMNLCALSLGILLMISFSTGICIWFMGGSIVTLLNVSELKPYLWIVPFALVGMGIYQILNYLAVRKAAFSVISGTKVSQGIALVTVQIIIGLIRKGPLGLVIGDFTGRIAGSGLFLRAFHGGDLKIQKILSLEAIKKVAHTYWKFPAYNLPNGLLNTVSQQIPNLLFASLFSPAIAGYYFLAIRVTSAPLSLIGKSVSQVFLQNAAARHCKGDELVSLVQQVHKRLFSIIIIPSLFLLIFSPVLFQYVFGGEWKVAGDYLRCLIPWLAAMFVVSPTTWVFSIVNKQETMLVFEIILLLSRVFVIVAGARLSNDPIIAVALFGLVGFVANLCMWRLLLRACRSLEDIGTS